MPTINLEALRQAKNALKEHGITPPAAKKDEVPALLDDFGLSLTNVISNISVLAGNAEQEALRLKANELALRLHGVLKDDPVVPQINIVLEDSAAKLDFLKPPIGVIHESSAS